MPSRGLFAAQANAGKAGVKLACASGRSHKRETEKQREWEREKARLVREKR